MFLHAGVLKKLMKQAFKSGLTVARTSERIYLAGDYWQMDIRTDFLPNTILAQIVELTGEIPQEGEKFRANASGNQYELSVSMEVNEEGFQKGLEVTKIILIGRQGCHQRVLQNREGNLFLVNDVFVDIVDNFSIDTERGESIVEDPLYGRYGILWKNNVCRFYANFRGDSEHERLLEEITRIDLTEDPPQ